MREKITSSQCFLSITHEQVCRFTRFRRAASSCYYLHVATLKHTQVISHTGSLFIFSHTHTIFFSRLISHKYFFCLSSSFLVPPPSPSSFSPPPSAASPQLPECVPMHGHKCTQSIPPHSQPVIPNSPPWGKLAEGMGGGGVQQPSEDRGRPTAGSFSGKKKRRKRKGPDER